MSAFYLKPFSLCVVMATRPATGQKQTISQVDNKPAVVLFKTTEVEMCHDMSEGRGSNRTVPCIQNHCRTDHRVSLFQMKGTFPQTETAASAV